MILVGNLGKDPESRAIGDGSVTNFSLATSESWKDKATGELQERTEWHRCAAYGRLADICAEYLRKGSKVYIEGSLRTRKWQNAEGRDQYSTEIVVSEMQMLDSRQAGGESHAGIPEAARRPPAPRAGQPEPSGPEFDDDIPF